MVDLSDTPAGARDRLREALNRRGEDIIVRRYYGDPGPNRPKYEAQIRARVTGLGNPELIGGIAQGKFKVVALVDPAAAVPDGMVSIAGLLPILMSDKVVIGPKEMTIEALDDKTRRLGGDLFGLDMQVKS
ncbi:hypothetical protein V1291_000045 [Nitrobacteraceae bacterium AZCC 1564]